MSAKEMQDIPSRRREYYFRIINDERNFHPITYRLHFLNDHFPNDKLDLALKWLIDNNHIGKLFIAWFGTECQNSNLEMHRKLLHIVENLPLARVIAGKNFIT